MSKIIYSFLLAAFLLCSSNDSISQIYSPKRTCLIQVYKGEIGVRELTGNNDGKDVEKYLKTVGLGKGYAWCAAFVKWCLLEAKVSAASSINGMALTTERKTDILYSKGVYKKDLLPGDVGTLYYASLKRIGHTYFFNGWSNKSAGLHYTVEGNTNDQNSREGDGVYLRIRNISNTHSVSRWIE